MDAKEGERKLVCVLFPGIIKNEEKALQCLGGTKGISEAYSNMNKKRLGLSFQPDNPYINKIYADVGKTTGVLLRVKVKKKKTESGTKREVVSTDVVGRVSTIYKFDGMGDFQYLPVHKKEDQKPQCIRDQILPTDMSTSDFLTQQATPYITPSVFTRSDKPYPYHYTYRKQMKEPAASATMLARPPNPTFTKFNLTDKFPTEPTENQIMAKDRKIRHNAQDDFKAIKKALEERPIWSLNAISYRTNVRKSSIRFLLPALAFYFTNGPWMKCWTRYGYDPRKDPNARLYQVLDFRLRGELSSKVTSRMSSLPSQDEPVQEGSVVARPGLRPTQRQIFYQYCDIDLPAVSGPLRGPPAPAALCHELLGWLPRGFEQACRDHALRLARAALLADGLKTERLSSEDEQNSDDQNDSEKNISTEYEEMNID